MSDTAAPTTALPAAAAAPVPSPRTAPPQEQAAARYPLALHLQRVIEAGLHPATRGALHPDPQVTCATCVHAVTRVLEDGTERVRCELAVGSRRGPDLVKGLRGCQHHERGTP